MSTWRTGPRCERLREHLRGDLVYVVVLLITTRLALSLVGVLARALLQPLRTEPYPWLYAKSVWLSIWGVWDTGWYLDVANNGYSSALHDNPAVVDQANYAFFPLYPLLMRLLAPVCGGAFNAGLVVSNASLLLTCLVLVRLVALNHDVGTARRAAKYLVLMPTAFILSGVFSESLFLALAVAAFYCVRKERLLLAGVCGFLAALTRSVGVVLVVPLALMYWQQRRGSARVFEPRAAALLLAPLGTVLFAAYNHALTGNALAFAQIQSAWGRTYHFPVAVLWQGLGDANVNARFAAWMTLAAVVVVVAGWRRIGAPYLVLALLLIAVPLCTGLNSMPRFLLAAFPLPIVAAMMSRKPAVDQSLTVFLAVWQGALMVFWANGFRLIV